MKVYLQMMGLWLVLLCCIPLQAQDFLAAQMKFPRVRMAKQYAQADMDSLLKNKHVGNSFELFLRAFKQENVLEVWAKNKNEIKFIHLVDYDFCTLSGELGPKRQMGDGQVPEGVYYIDRFNPQSSFHLSLGINYPNAADRVLCKGKPGGDIFIHGSCVSIGCIPITDEKIEELYWLAISARSNGQLKIPVHIFPFRMNTTSRQQVGKNLKPQETLLSFWNSLVGLYDHFEITHTLPDVGVDVQGKYFLRSAR